RLSSFFDTIYVRLFGQNFRPVFRSNILSDFAEGVVADADRIGAHVGDQTDHACAAELFAFVELLRDLHGALHRILEAVVRGALQRGSDERRRGRLLLFFARNAGDLERAALERGFDDARLLLVGDVGLFAFDLRQLG